MDALLDRLWELANEEDDPGTARRNERVTEARALWSALDVWLTSVKPQELCVGDGTFTKTLACIRSVLSDPDYWAIGSESSGDRKERNDGNTTVLASVNRVLAKVANRGEREREALIRDGVADLLVGCVEPPRQQQSSPLTTSDAAAILQTLQTLAVDARNRASLQVSQTIRVCLTLMQRHALELVVQLRGCQFLQQMALDEECKERIGRLGGLQMVISALTRFPEEAQLVGSALDLLFFLSIELEHREDPLQYRDANSATLEVIVKAVVNAMHLFQSVELVQSNGIAVLNSVAAFAPVKRLLPSLDIWSLAQNGLAMTAANETACDFVELLATLLRDPIAFGRLNDLSYAEHGAIKPRLLALKGQVKALPHNQGADSVGGDRMAFVIERLQSLLDEMDRGVVANSSITRNERLESPINDSQGGIARHSSGCSELYRPQVSRTAEEDDGDELPVDTGGYVQDVRTDDHEGLVLGESSGYFEQFLREMLDDGAATRSLGSSSSFGDTLSSSSSVHRQEAPSGGQNPTARGAERYPSQLEPMGSKRQSLKTVTTPSAASKLDCGTRKWPAQYETSSNDTQRTPTSSCGLDEKYRLVLRRSQEQAKLLSLQNARLATHASEHQQILRRMHSLEASLETAHRRYQVEYALRLAEAAQCEQLSLALNESRRETKTLAAQQSSAARELQQKESMRTEYMMRTRESKQDKQRVETQRDNALLQVESLKYEKLKLLRQLAECRKEGFEALCMREEDVDTRRSGVFSELAKAATAHDSSRSSRSTMERSRRNSLPFEACAVHPIEHLSSSASSSSLYNGSTKMFLSRTKGSGGDRDLNDDPDSIGTHEIQSCLASVFQSLDTSLEGTGYDGVHVSTVRRFFLESGLVQPPTVQPADVDVVLARVLAQSQANRKSQVARKDFSSTWAPPHGWAKTKKKPTLTRSASLNGDVKRFRFFDQDAFNEAVTLVGMRRFPRTELLCVLQTVVALYLRPYLRQQRSRSLSTAGHSRRSSTSSAGASSPSLVCNRAMRAILNGLALHLGHGNDRERLPTSGVDEGEMRYHLNPPDTLKRRHQRENVVFSMLEMLGVLSREQRPLGTICEFYSGQHLPNAAAAAAISAAKDELFGLSFELLLSFAMDFELIPAFMDRVSLKQLHSEVAGLLKAYFALHGKDPPSGADAETLKKVALNMILARLAIELFSTKTDYETPERQITGLLQWLDNSAGREKIMRKSGLPLVIRFSRQLYAMKM